MKDIEDQIQHHFSLLDGSMADPIFLLILCAGCVLGLFVGWGTGTMTAIFAGVVRVAAIDWQEFVPGAEPSAMLVDAFFFTVVTSLAAFSTGKFIRMLMFFPRPRR